MPIKTEKSDTFLTPIIITDLEPSTSDELIPVHKTSSSKLKFADWYKLKLHKYRSKVKVNNSGIKKIIGAKKPLKVSK